MLGIFFYINKLVSCQYDDDKAVLGILLNIFDNITGDRHMWTYAAL